MRNVSLYSILAVACLSEGGCSNPSIGMPSFAELGNRSQTDSVTPLQAGVLPTGLGLDEKRSAISLQAGDRIRLTVFGEDKVSGDYELDPSGYLSLPLAGTIPAAGSSKIELEQSITQSLKGRYLKDPKVTIDVISYRPIYVLGEVQKPGAYPFHSGLNVMSAIAVAGGSTYRASNSEVMIQRFGEAGLREYALDANVSIMPGDVIRLPERYF
jgi:protein involved in polysaccharide export with SLBB domain